MQHCHVSNGLVSNGSVCKYYRLTEEAISLFLMKVFPLSVDNGDQLHRLLFHMRDHTYWLRPRLLKLTSSQESALYCERSFLSRYYFYSCHSIFNSFCDSIRILGMAVLPPPTHINVLSIGPSITNFESNLKHLEHYFQTQIYASTFYHVETTSYITKKHVVISLSQCWSLFLTSLSLVPPPILSISQIHVQISHVVLLAHMCLTCCVFFCSQPYFQK